MVINPSVSAASLQDKQLSALKSNAQTNPANTGSSASSISVGAEYLAATAPEITSSDEAQQSTDFAANSILNQSNVALLAQGQHQSQTVMDLLAQ